MISFEPDQSINLDNFAKQLSIITLAESLGGVKSLISCPYSMTHASVPHDKKIKLGICGEHGGDPKSIHFCSKAGLDYVSCSPYRVPIARLAAAQAELKKKI